jgi:hypothetical protein
MKNIILAICAVSMGALIVAGSYERNFLFAGSDGCYNCGSGSKDGIQQCRYHGSDTYAQRNKCKAAGCKITGTSSCSTAANVKVIDPN